MISRIRDSPDHIFECYCEVVLPKNNNKPWILQTYPESFDDEEILSKAPEFACPFKEDEVPPSLHFSFVLTTINGQWLFGFCKFTANAPTCSLILTCLPWHNTFYKIIQTIGELSNAQEGILQRFLDELYAAPVPEPGGFLHLLYNKGRNTFEVKCDDHLQLPTIPEDKNLTEYFSVPAIPHLIAIFASMLNERRIIMTSANIAKLSACIQAANVLIYPMQWQHIFITVLPSHLIDYLHAPMPFMIGVPTSTLSNIALEDLGDVVLYNIDTNELTSPFNDIDSLPAHVISTLKRNLKTPNAQFGDGVARAFLNALVHLIGGYREAILVPFADKITFDAEAFLKTRPSFIKPFLQNILTLQIFQQFIEGRLELLNTGQGFSDRFELEVNRYDTKSHNVLKHQYKEWMHSMKKGGSILKTVRTKVKKTGKRAYKDLRSRIQDLQLQQFKERDPSQISQPRSAPSSPTQVRARPISLQISDQLAFAKEEGLQATIEDLKSTAIRDVQSRHYRLLHPDTPNLEETEDFYIKFEPINMDLMGDLQDLIFRRNSTLIDTSGTDTKSCNSLDKSSEKSSDSACSLPPPPLSSGNKRKPPSNRKEEPLLIQLDQEDTVTFDPLEEGYSTEQSSTKLPPAPTSTFYFPLPYDEGVQASSSISFQNKGSSTTRARSSTSPASTSHEQKGPSLISEIDPFGDLISWTDPVPSNQENQSWQTFQ